MLGGHGEDAVGSELTQTGAGGDSGGPGQQKTRDGMTSLPKNPMGWIRGHPGAGGSTFNTRTPGVSVRFAYSTLCSSAAQSVPLLLLRNSREYVEGRGVQQNDKTFAMARNRLLRAGNSPLTIACPDGLVPPSPAETALTHQWRNRLKSRVTACQSPTNSSRRLRPSETVNNTTSLRNAARQITTAISLPACTPFPPDNTARHTARVSRPCITSRRGCISSRRAKRVGNPLGQASSNCSCSK